MNELTGKCVNVVLAVEMGRGLEFLEHPVKITANFNGRPLESDLVQPDDCPVFNTELVWETEKKELRRARSSNAPLRVEVQLVDKNQRKDRVGFLLLSPRCASIIPFGSNLEIPFKWQKLLGVAAEHKSSHPELYLSLTIRDLTTAVQREEIQVVDLAPEEEENQEVFEKGDQVISIQYLPDGFIRIGNGESDETFLLSITIQVAYNLDLLLPEVLVFNQNREKYFISFRLLGITIKSKPFCRDLHANIPMNEKIVVRIRSEYDTLRAYLSEFCQIHVSFYCGRDKLGITKLAVDKLLKNTVEEEFLIKESSMTCEQKCYFKFPSPHGIIPTGPSNRQPHIEVATTVKRTDIRPKSAVTVSSAPSIESINIPSIEGIEYTEEPSAESIKAPSEESIKASPTPGEVKTETVHSKEDLGAEQTSPKESLSPRSVDIGCGDVAEEVEKNQIQEVNPDVSACGDQTNESKVLELQVLELETAMSDKEEEKSEGSLSPKVETVRSTSKLLKKALPLPSPDSIIKPEDIEKNITMYQQYCLDVILENITLKKHLKAKKLYFKFKHPRASAATMIASEMDVDDDCFGEDILLENTRCKMFFISSTEHIRRMIYAWPPKLIMTDENDQLLTEELDIYTAMFLAKQRTECSYITEWKSVRTYEPLAKISISMYLQEYGLTALPRPTHFDLLPPILDEEVAVKELRELQEWKEKQKAQFYADLKILEKQRMTKLLKDWAKRKKELEGKLTKSVVRCRNLSQELQAAVNNIRTKKALDLKESQLNSKPNCSLNDDLQKKTLKYSNYGKGELIETISKMVRDKEHLKEIISDLRIEIQQIKKTALTKEQTANLLQQLRGLEEKFEDAQKAKGYFKDQWKKAVREIHDLRSEEQKLIQEKIQNQKSELSQLSLDSFTHSEVGSGQFEYGQSTYSVPVHTPSHFEDMKWSNFDYSLGVSQSRSLTYNSNNM